MKYLPMSNEILNEISAMENEIFNEIINQIVAMENEIFTIEQWNISCWAMKYSMKLGGILNEMSNEMFDEISAMQNEIFNEIPTNEQWNIQWNNCHGERNIQWNTYQWAMKYSVK